MATNHQNVKLPSKFAVEMSFNERAGFCLVGTHPQPDVYDVLSRENNGNRFYSIEIYTPPNTTRHSQNVLKRLQQRIHWSYTNRQLKHNQNLIPIIKFTPKHHLPSITQWSFVPIIERNNNEVDAPTVLPHEPVEVPIQVPEITIIETIPKHAIRLLLLGALIQGEECPITGNAIDIDNGAVTSCFHLFEKESIRRWLALTSTHKKCPVCMQACDLYLLD